MNRLATLHRAWQRYTGENCRDCPQTAHGECFRWGSMIPATPEHPLVGTWITEDEDSDSAFTFSAANTNSESPVSAEPTVSPSKSPT